MRQTFKYESIPLYIMNKNNKVWINKRVKKVAKAYKSAAHSKLRYYMSSSKVEFVFPNGYSFKTHYKKW